MNYEGNKDIGVVGLSDVKQACMDIENKINDSISPQPDYMITIQESKTIKLTVKSDIHKPYLYKSKAYKRNDTATIEVDPLEFTRLVLEGKNIRFEEFNYDILRTLHLYDSENGYCNAAAILADENQFPGIDIARLDIDEEQQSREPSSVSECFMQFSFSFLK